MLTQGSNEHTSASVQATKKMIHVLSGSIFRDADSPKNKILLAGAGNVMSANWVTEDVLREEVRNFCNKQARPNIPSYQTTATPLLEGYGIALSKLKIPLKAQNAEYKEALEIQQKADEKVAEKAKEIKLQFKEYKAEATQTTKSYTNWREWAKYEETEEYEEYLRLRAEAEEYASDARFLLTRVSNDPITQAVKCQPNSTDFWGTPHGMAETLEQWTRGFGGTSGSVEFSESEGVSESESTSVEANAMLFGVGIGVNASRESVFRQSSKYHVRISWEGLETFVVTPPDGYKFGVLKINSNNTTSWVEGYGGNPPLCGSDPESLVQSVVQSLVLAYGLQIEITLDKETYRDMKMNAEGGVSAGLIGISARHETSQAEWDDSEFRVVVSQKADENNLMRPFVMGVTIESVLPVLYKPIQSMSFTRIATPEEKYKQFVEYMERRGWSNYVESLKENELADWSSFLGSDVNNELLMDCEIKEDDCASIFEVISQIEGGEINENNGWRATEFLEWIAKEFDGKNYKDMLVQAGYASWMKIDQLDKARLKDVGIKNAKHRIQIDKKLAEFRVQIDLHATQSSSFLCHMCEMKEFEPQEEGREPGGPFGIVAGPHETNVNDVPGNVHGYIQNIQTIGQVDVPVDERPLYYNPITNVSTVGNQFNRGNCYAQCAVSAYVNTCERIPGTDRLPPLNPLEMLLIADSGQGGYIKPSVECLENKFQRGITCEDRASITPELVLTQSVCLGFWTTPGGFDDVKAGNLVRQPYDYNHFTFPEDFVGARAEVTGCGGHAVLVEGYDFQTKQFRCKNSWGGSGENGRFWFDPRAAHNFIYTIVKVDENSPNYQQNDYPVVPRRVGDKVNEDWRLVSEEWAVYSNEFFCLRLAEPTPQYTHIGLKLDTFILYAQMLGGATHSNMVQKYSHKLLLNAPDGSTNTFLNLHGVSPVRSTKTRYLDDDEPVFGTSDQGLKKGYAKRILPKFQKGVDEKEGNPGLSKKPRSRRTVHGGPKKKVNLLLFGETGVGKSTLLQSLGDYIRGTPFGEHRRTEKIAAKGASQTQKSDMLNFNNDEWDVNIIDTPGLGDTRGMSVDEKHVSNLQQFLSDKEFNAVCVLIKRGTTRSVALLNYVVNELKANMPKSAADHFVVVMTRAEVPIPDDDTLAVIEGLSLPIQNIIPINNIAYEEMDLSRWGNDENSPFIRNIKRRQERNYEENQEYLQQLLDLAHSFDSYQGNRVVELKVKRDQLRERVALLQIQVNSSVELKFTLQQQQRELTDARGSEEKARAAINKTETWLEKVPKKSTGKITTHCNACGKACHIDCSLSYGDNLTSCAAMNGSTCGECGHSVDRHTHLGWTFTEVTRVRNFQDDEKVREMQSAQEIARALEIRQGQINDQLMQLQRDQENATQEIRDLYDQLSEIAILGWNDSYEKYMLECKKAVEEDPNLSDVMKEEKLSVFQMALSKISVFKDAIADKLGF